MKDSIIPIKDIKELVLEMFELVGQQVADTKLAVLNFDKDLCREVLIQEKKVNGLDLKIDKEAEKIMALYSPVAVDLRFIIASLNINTFLERIGDNTQSICNCILQMEVPFKEEVLANSDLIKQLDITLQMFDDIIEAFVNESSSKAAHVLSLDVEVDEINNQALDFISDYIKKDVNDTKNYLFLLSMIQKTERIGDLIKNLAEETIFYIDAKVLKHKRKKTNKYIERNLNVDPE